MEQLMIIFGGISKEHDISCMSAQAVITALQTSYELIKIYIDEDGRWQLFDGEDATNISKDELKPLMLNLDAKDPFLICQDKKIMAKKAMIIMHGAYGEDGRLQGMLEMLDIKVIGCGSVASMLAMHKDLAKKLVMASGIKTANFQLIKNKREIDFKKLSFPLFIKPNKQGSSFGASKVVDAAGLDEALDKAFKFDDEVLIEDYIVGHEVGCAIIGKEDLLVSPVDILLNVQDYFSFAEKYHDSKVLTQVPADLPSHLSAKIQNCARTIYKTLKCTGFARVDMFLLDNGEIYFNEVNTIPGLTEHSRFPGMFKAEGMEFAQILERMINYGNNC